MMDERQMQKELDLLRTILQHCAGTIFVTDGRGRIIYSNEESSSALGCSTRELIGTTIYDLVKQGLTNDAVSIRVIKEKRTISSRVYYKDGKETVVTGEPVFDDAGELIMVVVYGQKRETISMRIRSLEEDNKAIRQTLSHVMHDALSQNVVVAESPTTQNCLSIAEKAAHLDSTIMLYGESGSGKEVVARHIHSNSQRAQQIFLPVNCAAFPHELMESEFFGYDKGAFTGSNKDGKLGLFELADRGTLFLDEIGELNLLMQSKLLRVLETGEVKRVNGTQLRKVNVRIVAATNRDLKSMTTEGTFREDLFYRLNVIPITVPPLRDRQEDIPVLATYFLEQLNKKYSDHKRFARGALDVFKAYPWPGNVRELRNVIERLFVVSEDDITGRQVSDVLGTGSTVHSTPEQVAEPLAVTSYEDPLRTVTEQFQRDYITQVLKDCDGNVKNAAQKLGFGRSGLYKKLESLGLNIKRQW